MNVNLRGRTHEIMESMVSKGYANTFSEAIRLAIISFGETHFNEVEMVNAKLDWIDAEVSAGRRKTLNAKEALGKYSKYLK